MGSTPGKPRKPRSDAGKTRLTERDLFALTWIAHQYAIRLDHLQWLLGCHPGHGTTHADWVSESAARDVVSRWKEMGYVQAEVLLPKQPFWIWVTRKALNKLGLLYTYNNLEESSLGALSHLSAINEIRLDIEANIPDAHWTSERELLRGQVRIKGKTFLHRPDGVVVLADGQTVAIEAELSTKKPWELADTLLELLGGEDYLQTKIGLGWQMARTMGHWDRGPYKGIWYYAPKTIRKQVRRARSKLVVDGVIGEEDAKRISVLWYPLVDTDEEQALEEQEENEAFGLDSEDEDRYPLDLREGKER